MLGLYHHNSDKYINAEMLATVKTIHEFTSGVKHQKLLELTVLIRDSAFEEG